MSGPIDVFLIAGQSNAEGRGDSSLSYTATAAQGVEVDGSSVTAIADPVGGADTGSMWPAFAVAYSAWADKPCALVEAAETGTGLLSTSGAGSDYWSTGGSLWGPAETALNNALATLSGDGYTPTMRGVLWCQGERDAQQGTTLADYRDGLVSFAEGQVDDEWPGTKVYVWKTGAPLSGDTAAWQAIRDAQDAAEGLSSSIVVVHTDAVNYPDLGLMADNLHWGQVALNNAGFTGGTAVAQDIYPTRQGGSGSRFAPVSGFENLWLVTS